jgi:hypothetical protein
LSGADPDARELIGFEGAVSCELQAHAASLRLRGTVRGGADSRTGVGAGAAEVAFSGISFADGSPAQLPPMLQQVSVLELPGTVAPAPAPVPPQPAPAPRRSLRIESSAGRFALQARGVQVHRDAAREFFGALPPARVPRSLRAGWALLLTVLRVPGAARLLAKLRG